MSDNIFNLAKNTLLHSFHNFEAIFVGFGKRLFVDDAAEVEGIVEDEVHGLFINAVEWLNGEQTSFIDGTNTEIVDAAEFFTNFAFPIVQEQLNKILGIPS